MCKQIQECNLPRERRQSIPDITGLILFGMGGGLYHPGGACTKAIDSWASRVNSKSGDPENTGRWSTLRIQVKGTVISVITAYRVCRTPVNLESNTAYSQQWRAWKMKTDKKAYPKERTLKDLKEYMKGEINKKRKLCY